MKKSVIGIIVLAVVLANLFLVSASFTLGNKSYSVETGYSPGDRIAGWINISLNNEPSDSLLSSNFPGSISLIDFLEENSVSYSCMPSDCQQDYLLSNGQEIKNFHLNYGEEKILALNVSGIVSSVNNFSFSLNASNTPGCVSPIEIDIFDNGENEWRSWQFSDDYSCTYEGGVGCFSPTGSVELNFTDKIFCEKIKIVQSSKFKVGAWARKIKSGGGLFMELYGTDGGNSLASCKLPDASVAGGEVDCIINYNNTEIQDYYVCVKSNVSEAYATKMESTSPCGFWTGASTSLIIPPENQQRMDFYIFAKGAKFDRVGNLLFNQKEYQSQNSGELVGNVISYLRDKYSDMCSDCNINCTKGCAVPLKIKSYSSQDIAISSINLKYDVATSPAPVAINKLYDVSTTFGKISSGFLKLDLGLAGITVPAGYGNQSVTISLGSQEIFTKQITSAKVPLIKGVTPRIVAAGASNNFIADVSSPANKSIVKYSWDFGDDSDIAQSASNSASHIYGVIGSYTLTLEVQDSAGNNASKEFTIAAGSPRDIANSTLKKYRQRINNLTSQIASEPEWQKKVIESEIDLENLGTSLTNLEKDYANAVSDDELIEIMTGLNSLSVPISIKKSNAIVFPVLISPDDINLEELATMGAGDSEISSEESYKEAIISWDISNIDASISSYSFTAYYDDLSRQIANYFKLSIKAINPNDNLENYLIINDIAKFDSAQTTRDFDDATGIRFSSLEDRNVEFIIAGEKLPIETEIYFSPEFNQLELVEQLGVCDSDNKCEEGETSKNCRQDCKPWGWAVFLFILLLFIAFGVYIFLQEWYKRKYENYLFKNRNDLYNLVNYIGNAKARGLSDQDIVNSLKKIGWHSEQIAYAVKKVKGKKTGLPFEIGLPKKKENTGQQTTPIGMMQPRPSMQQNPQEKAFKLPFLFKKIKETEKE